MVSIVIQGTRRRGDESKSKSGAISCGLGAGRRGDIVTAETEKTSQQRLGMAQHLVVTLGGIAGRVSIHEIRVVVAHAKLG